ncbi:MAG: leucine-rich repeat domain-containing protein [Muribaculaceae bacterium]|nr:leucine-rich repeat domain-containing protein [Muribaculaceae bacterium]
MIRSTHIKSIILTVAMLLASATVWGVDFVSGNLAYTINSDGKSVAVSVVDATATGSIVIPSEVKNNGTTYKVTAIADQGFENTKLNSVTIPQSVTSIGEAAFNSATNLKSIAIPKSVEQIGKDAFRWCNDATSITFEKGSVLTEIAESVFNQCTQVKILELPEGVKTIRKSAFLSMTSLSVVILPPALTKIEDSALAECPALRFLKIQSEKQLGLNETVFTSFSSTTFNFKNCWVYVPAKDLSFYKGNIFWSRFGVVSDNPFDIFKSGSLTYATISDDEAAAIDSDQNIRTAAVPDQIAYNGKDYKVTIIGGALFLGNRSLTSLTISSNTKEICAGAFEDCWNLTALTLPSGLERIGELAFKGSGVARIIMPNSVKSLGRKTFGVTLKELRLSNSLTVLPEQMAEWSGISTLKVPEGVTEIQRHAFYFCGSLKEVTLPSTLKKMGEAVFNDCYSLTTVSCKAVTPPVCAEGDMFRSDIPGKATLRVPVGSYNSYSTTAPWSSFRTIVEVEFGDDNLIEALGMKFYVNGESSLKVIGVTGTSSSVSIPSTLSHEGITYTVNEIAENAFDGSRVTEVDIPATIEKVGSGAFKGLAMSKVQIRAIVPPACADDAFSASTYANATLLVGADCRSAYAAAAGWKNFRNISEEVGDLNNFTQGNFSFTIIDNGYVEIALTAQALKDMTLTKIDVPEQVTFQGQTYSVIRIADRGFKGLGCQAGVHGSACGATVTVTLPETIDEIGKEAFYGAHILAINLPSNLSLLGESCFAQCLYPGTIVIPESCTEVPANAFNGCRMSGVYIPASIVNFGSDAFAATVNMAKVEVEDLETFLNMTFDTEKSNPMCDGSWMGGARLYYEGEPVTEINFEDYGMTSLGDYALYGCNSLVVVLFPEDFDEIGYKALTRCKEIKVIGCKNNNAISGPSDPDAGFDANVYENASLYVPAGHKAAYMQEPIWQPFRNVIEASAGVEGVETDNTNISVNGCEIHNPASQNVKIYDVTGSLIHEGKENIITLSNGLYIVEAGETIKKICIN